MSTAIVICAAIVFALVSWYFERRHRALEARMTQQVKERYAAYIELEERVRVALGEFERLESTFESEIRKSRDQITGLEEALNTVEGIESVQPETPGGFLGVLDEGDANVQAQPVTLTGTPRDFEAELQKWERRVEAAQSEHCTEIERQRAQIAELTARVRQLDPSSTSLRHRSESFAQAAAATEREYALAPSDLGQRIDRADASANEVVEGLEALLRSSASSISELRETLATCKPLLDQQVRDRARNAELEQCRMTLEKSCASLEQRCGTLDGRLAERQRDLDRVTAAVGELEAREIETTHKLESTSEELLSTNAKLETTSEELGLTREELESTGEKLEKTAAELESSNSKLESTCEELGLTREELEATGEKLKTTNSKLEATSAELVSTSARLKSTSSALESAGAKLDSTSTELGQTRQQLTSERANLERETKARTEVERTRDELVRSVAELEGRLEEETTRGASLGGELDGARAQLEKYEEQCAELKSQALQQGEVLNTQTDMLRERESEITRLRSRVSTLESKLVSTRDTIGGQKTRLSELMETIQVAQEEQVRHKQILTDQSAHMQEARELLEALRPVMDSLEGDLDKKQQG